MKVAVTGGAGYIGSHTILQLLKHGHDVLSIDNYCNSSPESLNRVRQLTNSAALQVVEGDVRDTEALTQTLVDFAPDAVIHFAGLKAVGESVEKPVLYYENNAQGTVTLLNAMDAAGCKRIVFSSSATVYGTPQYLPFDEEHPTAPVNPYGWSKLMAEQIITDWAKARAGASAVLLRYFNPVGADESGRIGEDPAGPPNNLMPYIAQVASGRREQLAVFGDDYDTRDGTGERDYIHVVDLADAHVAAINFAETETGAEVFNIGTGQGTTVMELLHAFEAASGVKVPYTVAPRRDGDIASSIASAEKAAEKMGWRAKHGIPEICASHWHWQANNPQGYPAEKESE
ncbi:UDP-glucose 4-epimerase GalE [Paracoccaceae bacterium GXU_MW_L88]